MPHRTLLLCLLILLTLSTSAQRITHTFTDVPLSDALAWIDRQATDCHINYSNSDLENLRVTARLQNLTVVDAIAKITKGQPVRVKQRGQQITVQYSHRMERQQLKLTGKILDQKTHRHLVGATVRVLNADSINVAQGSAKMVFVTADSRKEQAVFSINVPRVPTQYILAVSYVGYETGYVNVSLSNLRRGEVARELPPIYLKQESHQLSEVSVTASKVMFYHRGDTIVYNADAFQLAEGSMLDALVRQLPGVELRQNGQIYLNGRFVESLLLNGKDFFRGNNEVMLDNLPSYMVKEIKVYDKYGDRSAFLGVQQEDDKRYVMDVRLKREYAIGWLANIEGGVGTDDRNLARLFALRFSDHSRVAVYGNQNNLNDSRKPGEKDTEWKPSDMASGLQSLRKGGIDYNTEDRDERWKIDGNAEISYTDQDLQATTERTNYFSTGNTLDRIQNANRNKQTTFTTRHNLNADFGRFNLTLSPSATYRRHDNRNVYNSLTFNTIDTLINSYLQQGKTHGHELTASLSAESVIKIDGANKYLDLTFDLQHTAEDNHGNKQHLLFVPEPATITQQNSRLHPNRNTKLYTEIDYTRQLRADLQLHTCYAYAHEQTRKDHTMYSLQEMLEGQTELNDMLINTLLYNIPMECLDLENSYDSHTTGNTHALKLVAFWYPKLASGNGSSGIQLRFSHANEQLHDLRHATDTTISYRQNKFEIPYSYFMWSSQDRRYYVSGGYSLKTKMPPLNYLVRIRNTEDPMNIYMGCDHLHSTTTQDLNIMLQKRNPERQRTQTLSTNLAYSHNAVVQGYRYDPLTGIRTWRPYNVNGNWNGDISYAFYAPVDKSRRLNFSTTTKTAYVHSVNIIDEQRNRIGHLSARETLKLSYNPKQQDNAAWQLKSLSLNADGTWRRVSSLLSSEMKGTLATNSFTATDLSCGFTAIVDLPDQLQASTDFTVYSRRGYGDARLNSTDWVWNARLSRPFFKGRLLIAIDGFDLLGQLSNVTRTINALSRTETRTNTLPRYLLLHAVWRWSRAPKKPQTNTSF